MQRWWRSVEAEITMADEELLPLQSRHGPAASITARSLCTSCCTPIIKMQLLITEGTCMVCFERLQRALT